MGSSLELTLIGMSRPHMSTEQCSLSTPAILIYVALLCQVTARGACLTILGQALQILERYSLGDTIWSRAQ